MTFFLKERGIIVTVRYKLIPQKLKMSYGKNTYFFSIIQQVLKWHIGK